MDIKRTHRQSCFKGGWSSCILLFFLLSVGSILSYVLLWTNNIIKHGTISNNIPSLFRLQHSSQTSHYNAIQHIQTNSLGQQLFTKQSLERLVSGLVTIKQRVAPSSKSTVFIYKTKHLPVERSNVDYTVDGSTKRSHTRGQETFRATLSKRKRLSTRTYTSVHNKTSKAMPATPHYLTLHFDGRLGNHLFEFASLLGIAGRNRLIPLVSRTSPLRNLFKITVDTTENHRDIIYNTYNEKKGCTYENSAMELGSDKNFKLNGFFQSWKYFTDIESDIRQQLKFSDSIMEWAEKEFTRITASKWEKGKKVTYIGVHIRRGDMVYKKAFVDYGYTSPSIEYIHKGMDRFRSLYPNCLFVLASDDIVWCKSHITGTDIVFLDLVSRPEQDMAVLTRCNHTLMTVGSFGWWISWLTNGTTIYYKGYPRPGSKLDKLFSSEDYIPRNWIGMI